MVRYGSFLVRLWRRDSEPRVVVQHIQSGATLRGSSLAVAMAWMSARAQAAERDGGDDDTVDRMTGAARAADIAGADLDEGGAI